MNVPLPRIITAAILLASSLAVFSGCAQQKFAVKDATQTETIGLATVQAIKVSDDASKLEIVADKPLIYTYYKTSDPPKVLIDLSQTDPGAFGKAIDVNSGNIKKIEVTKHEYSGGFFSRIEVSLTRDDDFTVATVGDDKRSIVLALASGAVKGTPTEPEAKTGEQAKEATSPQKNDAEAVKVQDLKAEEAKPVSAAGTEVKPALAETPPVEEPAAAAAVAEAPTLKAVGQETKEPPAVKAPEAPRQKRVTALSVGKDGIDITVSGGVDKYSAFTLTKPNRLIVDIVGAKSGISTKTVPIDSFGISKARLGIAADKVRVVFDMPKELTKPYHVMKTDAGLRVMFGAAAAAAAEQAAAAKSEETKAATASAAQVKLEESAQPTTATPVEKQAASAIKEAAPVEKQTASAAKETAPVVEGEKQAKSEVVTPIAAPATGVTQAVKGPAAASPAAENQEKADGLTAIDVVKDGIELVIGGSIDKYAAFKMTDPERLVVDIFGVKNRVAAHSVAIGSFGIDKARVGVSPDKLRIVFDATKGGVPAYQVVKSDRGLKVDFSSPVAAAAPTTGGTPVEPSAAPAVEEKKKSPRGGAGVVNAIDFQVMEGYSRIAVKLDGDCIVGKPGKTRDGLTLTLRKCLLPKKLQRMLDTGSFASVVRSVTPYAVRTKGSDDTRIMVKLRAAAPFTVKQEEGVVYWDIKNTQVPEPKKMASAVAPASAAGEMPPRTDDAELATRIEEVAPTKSTSGKDAGEAKKAYTGRRVTLEFSDADIRKIFQLIAEVSNLNFLIADDVTGTISLKLVNVPWDQALDVILESKGLEMKREGNIVQIKPKGKFKSMADADLEARRAREKQMELHTVVVDINYAGVGDIAGQLDKLKSAHDNVGVSMDSRTNRVIITDIQPNIDRMRELIKTLDMPEKQVMIEARIVEASTNFARDMGVQWTLSYADGSASIANINNLTSSFGGIVSSALPSNNAGGITTGVSFGKLTSNIQLDLRLSAAATSGLVKIISTPKVVTLNNKAAKISQGQSIPYQSTSAEGTKTEFVEAALTLEVTPHITADGNIAMKIKASNNSPGSGTPPPINKKEATTELAVKNGETTVIGGIYVDSDSETDTGVPFLKDIPLLGWLFKSNSKSKTKTELLIFITPKILS